MKLNDKAINLIAEFEGYSDRPYFATEEERKKGIVTIGYGMTFYPNGKKVSINDSILNKNTAIQYLGDLAEKFSLKVSKLIKQELTSNQFNAVVSLVYNIGIENFRTSTILKLININPNDANIAKQFLRWNKQNGIEVKGLTNRRIKESSLYFTK